MIPEFYEKPCPREVIGDKLAYYVIPHTLDSYSSANTTGVIENVSDIPSQIRSEDPISLPELTDPDGPIKVLFPYKSEFYHFFEVLASIVIELETTEREPNEWAGYIMIPILWADDWYRNFIDLFITRVKDHYGVHLVAIYIPALDDNPSLFRAMEVRNAEAIYSTWNSFNVSSYGMLRAFIRSWPEIKPREAGRIAYIQRKGRTESSFPGPEELQAYKEAPNFIKFPSTYPRIYQEADVVGHISASAKAHRQPFEAVSSEDFKSISDQIAYYSKVDILISPTGSGFMNMIFMEDEATVVELATSLVRWHNYSDGSYLEQGYDNIYSLQAFASNLRYIGIPHNRDPKIVIKRLSNLRWFL